MNKKLLLIAIGTLFILLFGAFLVKNALFSKSENKPDVSPTPVVVFPTVTDDVVVTLTATAGKRAVSLKISQVPKGTEMVEYEMKYLTGSGLIHGLSGTIRLAQGEESIEREDLTLGSCSSGGKCTYDEGVTSIDVVIKFTGSFGSSIFQKSFPI